MHYALFIVSGRGSGKSTLIRALTGFEARRRLWRVKSLSGRDLWAFIIHQSPQELGMRRHPPQDFPDVFEKKYGVSRNEYNFLISALEIHVRNPQYSYRQYINSARRKGFDARIAIINKYWNGKLEDPIKVQSVQNFASFNGILFILVDASQDPNVTANKIRNNLYP